MSMSVAVEYTHRLYIKDISIWKKYRLCFLLKQLCGRLVMIPTALPVDESYSVFYKDGV